MEIEGKETGRVIIIMLKYENVVKKLWLGRELGFLAGNG